MNKTRKLAVLVVLLSTLLLAGAGCMKQGALGGTQGESALDKVQSSGVLRVGYFIFEPATMLDKDGKPYGLFIDAVEQIAKDLRWKVEYKQVDLKNFAAGLQANDFDLSIGATFSSPSRASGAAFTQPLFYLGYTGVCKAEDAEKFKSWADVDQSGVRVAVKQGSAIGDYVTRNFTKAKIVSIEEPALSAPLAAVPAQADVGLMNQLTVYTYLRDNSQANLKEVLADKPVEFTGVCWAVKPGDAKWLTFINSALKHYEDTGRMAEWERKYKIPFMYHEKRSFQFDSGTTTGVIEQ